MRKLALLFLALATFLSVNAWADSTISFTNIGGTLSGTTSGLTLSGSTLVAVDGFGGLGLITGNDLGSVEFTTGALTSGSLDQGGTFAAGGSFTITGNGSNGLPNGVIFSGSFSGPVTWTLVTLADGTHNYTLSGAVIGTLIGGGSANGATLQLTINTGKGFFNGSTEISSGDTNIVVPEPGTLGLLGSGLLGIAGLVRRKKR